MKKINFKAIIFDMDGVITNTAKVHGKAWKIMFDEFLKRYAIEHNTNFIPFDEHFDYLNYVDGKPRLEGIKSFLKSRNIELPMGQAEDAVDKNTIYALGNLKNSYFTDVINKDGPELFETSVNLIKELKKQGVKIGLATSSKNADLILGLAKIEHLFQAKVDGILSEELNLKGKPEPDIFIKAAQILGFEPSECVMVEDAISGVQAGKNGNFGFVIGIARSISGDELSINGADIVVRDLGELRVDEINNWFTNGLIRNSWYIKYQGFNPKEEKLREVLCTIGNGYMANRAALESSSASNISYPATYMSGLFNKLPTTIQGKTIYNNDIVNIPNWTCIKFRINNGNFIDPLKEEILSYQQGLDMERGLMKRRIIFKDKSGRITKINSCRILSMHNPHIATIKYQITPLNYKGNITIRSSIDANLINDGVARYRELNQNHIKFKKAATFKNGVYLIAQTTSSKVEITTAMINLVYCSTLEKVKITKKVFNEKNKISEDISFYSKDTQSFIIEKIVSIHNSNSVSYSSKKALFDLKKINSFNKIYTPHTKAWKSIWDKIDIKIEGDRFSQKALRLHMFHLIASYSHHNLNTDSSIGARGLHGEAYRGHIFWDELYIQPFYTLHNPDITKAMLMYRYRRLDAARSYAKEFKYNGAMYPWQTADDGSEETQILHYNPVSGDWKPDLSSRQRHVNIAIFYNIYKYFKFTEDLNFMEKYGAEMMLDISKFWASITKLEADNKYHIEGVMGPDEFHEKLADSEKLGLKDNSYTNIMVVWLLEEALKLEHILPKSKFSNLCKKLNINKSELEKWNKIINNMYVPIKDGIIEQFEGYSNLKELDFNKLRLEFNNIKRVDRLLKAKKDSPDNYKVAKQADTLLLFYLLRPIVLKNILDRLGYKLGDPIDILKKHYNYYEPRTSHDSTLSMIVHAVLSKNFADDTLIWDWFYNALISDIKDTQGGTTPEGIHAGVMAGTIDIFYRNFAGISFEDNIININPKLPRFWKNLSFKLLFKKVWYFIEIDKNNIKIKASLASKVRIKDKVYKCEKNKTKVFKY